MQTISNNRYKCHGTCVHRSQNAPNTVTHTHTPTHGSRRRLQPIMSHRRRRRSGKDYGPIRPNTRTEVYTWRWRRRRLDSRSMGEPHHHRGRRRRLDRSVVEPHHQRWQRRRRLDSRSVGEPHHQRWQRRRRLDSGSVGEPHCQGWQRRRHLDRSVGECSYLRCIAR